MSSRRKMLMDQLFEKWDNDGSGYLDQDEVENVMQKYKDGQENEAIEKGQILYNLAYPRCFVKIFSSPEPKAQVKH